MTAKAFRKTRHRQKGISLSLLLLAICALFALIGCEKRGEVKPLWIAQFPFHFLDTYHVSDGVIVAFGSDKEIYPETETLAGTLVGLDLKTGNKLWQSQIEADGRYLQQGSQRGGSFTVVNAGQVYFRDHSNVLRALDIHTGTQKWQANDVLSILTLVDGQVLTISAQKKLAALDASSGAVQKVTELEWRHEYISSARMQIADGREYLAVDGIVTANDRASGKQLWSTAFKTEGIELLATQGVLVLTNLSTFTVFEGASGKKLWEFETQHDAKLPTIDGDIAYTDLDAKGEYHPGVGVVRGFKLASGEKIVEVNADGVVVNGVLYGKEWVDHYDPVSKSFVNGFVWKDSSDLRVVAKDANTGAKLWTAEPWCWGWIEKTSVRDQVAYAIHVSVLATEPVRLLAYRAGRSAER